MALSDLLHNARAMAAAALAPVATPGAGAGGQPQTAAPVTVFPLAQTSVSVKLDGSGNGTAQIGPSRVKEHWQVEAVSVSATTGAAIVNDAQCSVYLGAVASPATFLSQTSTGSSGDTCQIGKDIQPGQLVIAKWAGGDANAVATLAITGNRTIGAPAQ